MIRFKIMSPLPDILRMSQDSRTLKAELPFTPGLTLYGAMEQLSSKYPSFARRLAAEGMEAVLGGLLFSIDSTVYERPDRGDTPLADGCEVLVFLPYAGG